MTDISLDFIGKLLQRGGEELGLIKLTDRFIISVNSTQQINQINQQIEAQFQQIITGTNLAEYTIINNQLDAVMAKARTHPDIKFVGHIYQLENSPGTDLYILDQITIQFEDTLSKNTRDSLTSPLGLTELKPLSNIPNTFIYQVTNKATENPLKITNRLINDNRILSAEPNIIVKQQPYYKPKEPLYPQQWYLYHQGGSQLATNSHIAIESAWDITKGDRRIVVAVADDGFDLNHPDLQGNKKIVSPLDMKDQDSNPTPNDPTSNHGTACAGLAIAEENGKGIIGVAPNCAFMPIKTTGFLSDDVVEQIFNWAINKKADIISCSWGAASIYFPLSLRQKAAIAKAATEGRNGKGCVIVFAAGNANRPTQGTINERGWTNNYLSGPVNWLNGLAIHPDVITVSASTSLNRKAAYSNWGTNISVCAPSNNAPPGMWFANRGYLFTAPTIQTPLLGLEVLSTDRLGVAGYTQGDFADFGGTSSATPIVAGVAALMLSINPQLTSQEVKQILQQTADKIIDNNQDPQLGTQYGTYSNNGYSPWFGYGKVNAYKAVQAAKDRQQPTPKRRVAAQNRSKIAIPDNNINGITSTIQISESGQIQNLEIRVMIDHQFLGDVQINLTAPSGVTVVIQPRTLGLATKLDQTYNLLTTPHLDKILNQSAQGIWKLGVRDLAPSDTGILNGWELTLSIN